MIVHRVQGVAVPALMYGTAWKEDETRALTRLALASGFRAVDTANQRKHYVEAAAGEAVQGAIDDGLVSRADLFLQTKFTYRGGQDHRLPYDPNADPAAQVARSFESSLEHLRSGYVDSYLLHGPAARRGLTRQDFSVWRAMERLHRAGKARLIGVSNVTLEQLVLLEREAAVKPAFVQNRCYASTGWDRAVRAFCAENGIVYQAFSLLTANRRELSSEIVRRVAERVGRSPEAVVFRFALAVGMLPLTGTSSAAHMSEDLAAVDIELEPEEISGIESLSSVRAILP